MIHNYFDNVTFAYGRGIYQNLAVVPTANV